LASIILTMKSFAKIQGTTRTGFFIDPSKCAGVHTYTEKTKPLEKVLSVNLSSEHSTCQMYSAVEYVNTDYLFTAHFYIEQH